MTGYNTGSVSCFLGKTERSDWFEINSNLNNLNSNAVLLLRYVRGSFVYGIPRRKDSGVNFNGTAPVQIDHQHCFIAEVDASTGAQGVEQNNDIT